MIKRMISPDWLLSVNGGEYKKIDLPNDYAITQSRSADARGGSGNGFFNGGIGTYLKYIKFEDADNYILDIDGAYMCAQINVNEHKVAMHPHGYTPFLVDITNKVNKGKLNKIKIVTNDMQPSSRWYSGAGIYRDVFLWTGGKVRVQPWDVFIKTVSANEDTATIEVSYTITADIDAVVTLCAGIENTDINREIEIEVKAGQNNEINLVFNIEDPQLWSIDSPSLYELNTTITAKGGEILDRAVNTFGIREISFDTTYGFRLNGKQMKLKGGCIHHDHGALGAISLPAAEERKIKKLKEVGFNAVRIAHNPPSLALLEVCDRLGMLVMDEAFDMWNAEKRYMDYHLWFSDWCRRDISYMVKRDRNHPCVISYSIGNEIFERDCSSDGAKWAAVLADEVRKYDTTRPVTSAICGDWNRAEAVDPDEYKDYLNDKYGMRGDKINSEKWADFTAPYLAPLDIHGYNYFWFRIEEDTKKFPNRIFWHSETKALQFYDSWNTVINNNHVLGDFTWTAYDNLGEAGTGRFSWARDGYVPGISLAGYPWRTCYQGDFDICGFRRPQSYFREAIWKENVEPRIFTTHPEHTGEDFSGTGWHWYDVHESWSFDDKYIGMPVKCETYTNADKIEWYLNGRLMAESVPEKAIAFAMIPYERGEITAIACKNGEEYARYTLASAEKASHLSIEAEKSSIICDTRDIAYFTISVTDKNGKLVTEGEYEIRCEVDGGELLCLYSGNPCNEDDYPSKICHTFEGHALAAVRTDKSGIIRVTVSSEKLSSDITTVVAQSS